MLSNNSKYTSSYGEIYLDGEFLCDVKLCDIKSNFNAFGFKKIKGNRLPTVKGTMKFKCPEMNRLRAIYNRTKKFRIKKKLKNRVNKSLGANKPNDTKIYCRSEKRC